MNTEDKAAFQQAMQLANVGQKLEAYHQFQAIRNRMDYPAPDLLLWIAFTTPYAQEGQEVLNTVVRIAPQHPGLVAAQAHYAQKYQQYSAPQSVAMGPVLHCPYCRAYAPVRIERRVSTAGWVLFVVLLFVTIIFCWIGLLIKEDYRVCSNCGAKLG